MSGDRIKCIVPFCKRTARAEKHEDDSEIICGKCWRFVTPATKAARQRLRRRTKRVDRLFMRRTIIAKPTIRRQADVLTSLFDRASTRNWERCKEEAIGNRAGIGG